MANTPDDSPFHIVINLQAESVISYLINLGKNNIEFNSYYALWHITKDIYFFVESDLQSSYAR
ncbi:hypothetical protein GNF09_30330 [Nostoc sp. UCD120]|nr:hypothetical protein [Nostoc sp. UCD120]